MPHIPLRTTCHLYSRQLLEISHVLVQLLSYHSPRDLNNVKNMIIRQFTRYCRKITVGVKEAMKRKWSLRTIIRFIYLFKWTPKTSCSKLEVVCSQMLNIMHTTMHTKSCQDLAMISTRSCHDSVRSCQDFNKILL